MTTVQEWDSLLAKAKKLLARLDVAAAEDADLNRQSLPATKKLLELSHLATAMKNKSQSYMEALLHSGLLRSLRKWLEPLPDGSLPCMTVRSTIFQLLLNVPMNFEEHSVREELRLSGLGKAVAFFAQLDEESYANRKMAKDVMDKWSRGLLSKSTDYELLRGYEMELKKPRKKQVQVGNKQSLYYPEPVCMDFVLPPKPKVDFIQAIAMGAQKRAREKKTPKGRLEAKVRRMVAQNKRKLHYESISVEGRGLSISI